MEVPSSILNRYLARRQKDLEDCKHSIKSGNFALLQRVGHQLKGNGLTFGHPELSSIGNNLENAALLKDLPKLDKVLKEFAFWVDTNTNSNSSL